MRLPVLASAARDFRLLEQQRGTITSSLVSRIVSLAVFTNSWAWLR